MSKKFVALIVDDEPCLREIIAEMFADSDFAVLMAESGNQAFEIIQKDHTDIIISDVRMPKGDGMSLVDKIATLSEPKPKIILVTGDANISPDEAVKRGAAAMFSKPIDFQMLIDFAKKCVGF